VPSELIDEEKRVYASGLKRAESPRALVVPPLSGFQLLDSAAGRCFPSTEQFPSRASFDYREIYRDR